MSLKMEFTITKKLTITRITLTESNTVLIVDYGSQVTQLIARRLHEAKICCRIEPFSSARTDGARAVILAGSPHSVTKLDAPQAPAGLFESGLPVLGICYGQQLLAQTLGGRVEASGRREFGRAEIEAGANSPLLAGFAGPGERRQVWMSHGDEVRTLPPGFTAIGTSPGAPFAAIADEDRKLYGVQFHPEVAHTPDGDRILRNFAGDIASSRNI